jgi:hypothetical protein
MNNQIQKVVMLAKAAYYHEDNKAAFRRESLNFLAHIKDSLGLEASRINYNAGLKADDATLYGALRGVPFVVIVGEYGICWRAKGCEQNRWVKEPTTTEVLIEELRDELSRIAAQSLNSTNEQE